jgi:integrase
MTGHIRQRSPGSWELRYSLGNDPATGKRRVVTTTVRGTQKDANKELRRLLRTIDTGEHVDPTRILMREWLAQWLAAIKPEVSLVTHERYTGVVQRYLAPAFGNVPLTKLTPHTIQAKYTELAEGGRRDGKPGPLAASTRRFLHDVLNSALTRAVELQLIVRNPTQVLRRRLPKKEHVEMATLTPEEAHRVLDAVRHTPHYWPILLALATGARRGEACALCWRHVDLDRGHIRIVESLKQTSRGIVRGPTKSSKSRVVTLPATTIDELRRWKREQAEQLLRVGMRQGPDTVVCTQPDGGLIGPEVLTNFFSRLAKRLGLPVHFHSLRHTHATALLLAGVHPKVAQERLGHSSIAVTMDVYSHVTERLQDDAAAKIDHVLWRAR